MERIDQGQLQTGECSWHHSEVCKSENRYNKYENFSQFWFSESKKTLRLDQLQNIIILHMQRTAGNQITRNDHKYRYSFRVWAGYLSHFVTINDTIMTRHRKQQWANPIPFQAFVWFTSLIVYGSRHLDKYICGFHIEYELFIFLVSVRHMAYKCFA
jgi:hypothetical protein